MRAARGAARIATSSTAVVSVTNREGERERPKYDPLQYVRDYYHVPAYIGVHVVAYGKPGMIIGGDGPYIRVRLDGEKHDRPYHPTDGIEYRVEGAATA